jgi:hypothetical protein
MEEHLGEEAVGPPLNMIGDRALFLREVPSASDLSRYALSPSLFPGLDSGFPGRTIVRDPKDKYELFIIIIR